MPAETPNWTMPYPLPDDAVTDYPAVGQDLAETLEAQLSWMDNAYRNLITMRDPCYAARYDLVPLAGAWVACGPSFSAPQVGPYLLDWHIAIDNGVSGYWGGIVRNNDALHVVEMPLPDQGQFNEGHNNFLHWSTNLYMNAGDSIQLMANGPSGNVQYRHLVATYGAWSQALTRDGLGVGDPTELPGGPNYKGTYPYQPGLGTVLGAGDILAPRPA